MPTGFSKRARTPTGRPIGSTSMALRRYTEDLTNANGAIRYVHRTYWPSGQVGSQSFYPSCVFCPTVNTDSDLS